MPRIQQLINDDCLNALKNIDDKSIDLVLTDPPYSTTAHGWDKLLNFGKVWEQLERIIKDDGIIAIFATEPFTHKLIASNEKLYRYSWLWIKDNNNGFLNCNYRPLKISEDIVIFSFCKVGSNAASPIRYYPQGLKEINKQKRNNPNSKYRGLNGYTVGGNILNSDKEYIQRFTGYPNNLLFYQHDQPSYHPTQKPVKLLEYLIKTYTKENETVLDFTAGSGSTGLACQNTNRDFIGIEKDSKYFEIMKKRLEENEEKIKLEKLSQNDVVSRSADAG